MIQPVPLPPPEENPAPASATPKPDPVVLEDLAALIRLPTVFKKLDAVLIRVREATVFPEDFPMRLVAEEPRDGVREYGWRWRDKDARLDLFAGMTWGDEGHDPAWEVRVEVLDGLDPKVLRAKGLHRLAAKRAESRFTEWDAFWHEDRVEERFVVGATAACTRFMEEEDPDAVAADYLGGALHALHASGALHALLQAAREAG